MKLDAQEIKQLVSETEREYNDWSSWADKMEDAWRGYRYEDNRKDKQELDGVDTVVSPDMFNVIQLLQRFVATDIRVEVPSISTKDDDEDRSELIEEFLVAFDTESNRERGTNHVNDKTWQAGVLGRGASRVIWIGDALKEQGITNRLPILRETLDPRNVGVGRGAYGVNYAYHKYKCSRAYVEEAYPKFQLPEEPKGIVVHGYYQEKHEVIDYWFRQSGAIWHAVVIDGKFAKNPVHTDYPDIPIIEHFADGAPVKDKFGRSLPILYPIYELWKMKCDLLSKIATGLMYHYDPLMIAKGFGENDHVNVGPGETIYLRENQSLDAFRPEPNVPMAQSMLTLVQQGIDQATFPGVTYGEGAGGQSGFAINSLSQAARSRANTIRNNAEASMEHENQLILGLIEAFAPDDGVEIYSRSGRADRGKPLKISGKHIKGNYANKVMLVPEQPMDDTQRVLAWMQLAEKGIVSNALMRNRVINIQMPKDEETRIAVESALKSEQMQLKVQLRALQKTYNQDDWELMIVGTPLEQIHQQEQQWREQKRQEAEAAKAQRAAEKEAKRMQELMANMPPLPPGMPPMDPMSSMQPGPESLGLPPSLPPMGQPGSMGDPSMMQPQGMEGVPPQMAAQFSPNELGLQGAPAGTMDMLLGGGPPSPEELMNQGGQPPMPPAF